LLLGAATTVTTGSAVLALDAVDAVDMIKILGYKMVGLYQQQDLVFPLNRQL
jgi:hypothetical protein